MKNNKAHMWGKKCKPPCYCCGEDEIVNLIAKQKVVVKEVQRLSSLPIKKLMVELKGMDNVWLWTLGQAKGGLALRKKLQKREGL